MTKQAKTVSVATETAKADDVTNIVEVNQLLKSTKSINEAIEKAVFKGTSLQNDYQLIVCSVLAHLNAHKDIRIVRHLIDTMPKSLNSASMVVFIETYGAVAVDDKGQLHYNKEKETNLKDAIKKAWWKAKPIEKYVPFDLLKNLQRVLNRAEKRLQEGVDTEQGDNLNEAQVEQLRSMVNALEATPESEAQAA